MTVFANATLSASTRGMLRTRKTAAALSSKALIHLAAVGEIGAASPAFRGQRFLRSSFHRGGDLAQNEYFSECQP